MLHASFCMFSDHAISRAIWKVTGGSGKAKLHGFGFGDLLFKTLAIDNADKITWVIPTHVKPCILHGIFCLDLQLGGSVTKSVPTWGDLLDLRFQIP